ncbi:MAG: hypothetical protein PWQ70_3175 [Clostridiales bacterium]|nr:hypothetical protein [Clostridiales bacterium]
MSKNDDFSVKNLDRIILGSLSKEKGKRSKVVIRKEYVGLRHRDLPTLTFMTIEYGHSFEYILDQVNIQEIMNLSDGESIEIKDSQNKKVVCTRDGDLVIFDSPEHSTVIEVPFDEFTIKGEPLSPEEIDKAWRENRRRLFKSKEAEEEFDGINSSSLLEDEVEDVDIEKIFEETLEQVILESDFLAIDRVSTFEEAGIMSNNKGLVINVRLLEDLDTGEVYDGPFEFQLTIVQRR